MTYFQLPESTFYALALIGILGLAGIVGFWITTKDRGKFQRLLGTCILWQLLPAGAWMYSYWDSYTIYGPSSFFRIAEATTVVVVPIVSGLAHRSWKVATLSLALPFIGFGLMMAGFMIIMGNGR